jgi:hypothetical protein
MSGETNIPTVWVYRNVDGASRSLTHFHNEYAIPPKQEAGTASVPIHRAFVSRDE